MVIKITAGGASKFVVIDGGVGYRKSLQEEQFQGSKMFCLRVSTKR